MNKPVVYLDHNASTPVDKDVLQAMRPWLEDSTGANPSSSHTPGRSARHAIDTARQQVATVLHCEAEEVIFTCSGTAANNLALLGGMRASKKKHCITSKAEHSSILEPINFLRAEGFTVDEVEVDENCFVDPQKILARVNKQTAMVALMLANNEIGTLQPIAQLAAALPKDVLLHCDGIQAVGKIPVDLTKLNVSLFALSAHKFYGPPGIGALIKKKHVPLQPCLAGGAQEQSLWPGSENVPAIVGLGCAIQKANQLVPQYQKKFSEFNKYLRQLLAAALPEVQINSPQQDCLSNTLNITLPHIDGRSILIQLDLQGFAISLGSACASGSILPSHVLLSMGKTRAQALASIRISMGWGNEKDNIENFVVTLKKIFTQIQGKRRLEQK